MRSILLLALSLVFAACSQTGPSSHRPSYVISKSTTAEAETTIEPLAD